MLVGRFFSRVVVRQIRLDALFPGVAFEVV